MKLRFWMLGAFALSAGLVACGGGGGGGGSGGSGGSGGNLAVLSPIVLSPASMSFLGVGSTQSVAASESGYSGSFSGSGSTCSGIASIALQSGSTTAFVVTPIAAGSCSFTIADTLGQSKNLPVSVTTTTIVGS